MAGLRLLSEGIHYYTDNWGPHPTAQVRSLSSLAGPQSLAIRARNRRIVYPYSVVPGGVASADELREAAAHDAAVAAHYEGFNYKRAKMVAVDHPRLVYLSYRREGHIFWTRKQLSLHPGEKLLTDGRITARARCGNQVSVLPQANTSPNEPLIAELDRPDALASGEVSPPDNFNSKLLQTEPAAAGPASSGNGSTGGGSTAGGTLPGAGGTPIGPGPPGVFVPFPGTPPISSGGGCVPTQTNNHCKPVEPPPPAVPEPGTVVLVLSGAAAVFARYRYKRP